MRYQTLNKNLANYYSENSNERKFTEKKACKRVQNTEIALEIHMKVTEGLLRSRITV